MNLQLLMGKDLARGIIGCVQNDGLGLVVKGSLKALAGRKTSPAHEG